MFNRILKPSKNNSFFIFGARGTGKSTWLRENFSTIPHLYIDLLDPDIEDTLAKNPNSLLAQIEALPHKNAWVLIDEVQKLPKLLDLVHLSIEKNKTRFVLTGSSARKLKRGGANLLAGRAFVHHLFPLTHRELKQDFDLQQSLHWGTLPQIFQHEDPQDKTRYLRTYAQTYLKEEILVEQVVRKLDPFRHFLEIAAQHNGEIINFSNIARDIGVDTVTVQSYFRILEDTLVGYLLQPFHQSLRKRQRKNPKFYFFDLGVKRSLAGMLSVELKPNTYEYGKAFEHFLIVEIMRLNSYLEKDYRLSYLRTKDNAEIDLIIEKPGHEYVLIEIKSSVRTDERDIKHLLGFKKDITFKTRAYCLSQDSIPKVIDGVRLLPWEKGLEEIFA
jgi:uncharacterized protein